MTCWLPERFDDLVFRLDTLYRDERYLNASSDFIYIYEDSEICGLILPDGDSFNSCIKNGYEDLYRNMLDLGEKELQPLFSKPINFLVVSHESLTNQTKELVKCGYTKDKSDYFKFIINCN